MSHFMIRWQFTDTSAKALVGKPHDRTGAMKVFVEGFGGKPPMVQWCIETLKGPGP